MILYKFIMAFLAWLLDLSSTLTVLSSAAQFQPKVITVESYPSRRVFGSISMAEGSPWCQGKPTFWLIGHQGDDETPWCLDSTGNISSSVDYSEAHFKRPRYAVLDSTDLMNGRKNIDRHDCVYMDVNLDGIQDIVCGVGADRGKGQGFNELYLTSPNGTVTKVLDGHGLQKYPTIRTRYLITLKGANRSKLVFIAARGQPRTDGQPNDHRLYRLLHGDSPYFREVPGGIWKQNTIASSLLKVDLNNDGLDDILICNERSAPLLFVQHANCSWSALPALGPNAFNWRSARVADVTGDGFPDIVVVGRGRRSYLKVFQGFPTYPHYDFDSLPYFEMTLPFAAPDVEVLDVNEDGRPDLYVVQVDETPDKANYCSFMSRTLDFFGEPGPRAPNTFTPPLDQAKDILLIADQDGSFMSHTMDFAEPGCGSKVERFGGGKTMILAQGSEDRSGHNLLLQW